MKNNLALGIDIGGTNIKIGIFDSDGTLVKFDQFPTPKSPPVSFVSIVAEEAKDFLSEEDLDFDSIVGVGIGFPGAIKQPEGIVTSSPNLAGWNGTNIGNLFIENFGARTVIDNDANLATFAEYKWGSGKGENPLVLFTLGTGVGGGIVIDGEIFHGAWGGASEIGHQTIALDGRLCKCGNRGCLEAYIGSSGIATRACELLKTDKGSLLWELMQGSFDSLTAELVGKAANMGDPVSLRIGREIAIALGTAVANIMNIINPSCILFAGGMVEWGEELIIKPVIEEAKRRALKEHFKSCRLSFATWGVKAGVAGGSAIAFHKFESI